MKETVMITGASHGIGHGIARYFAANGYQLVLNGCHDTKALEKLKMELTSSFGGDYLISQGDVGDSQFVNHMFKEATDRFHCVDILINNAGISKVGLLSDLSDEDWKLLLDTNLSSVFYTCRAAIPGMVQAKKGKILNISSIWGVSGGSCEAAYSATKGGINALTKALAKELAPSNIQVNAIACGVIDTRMNQIFTEEERQSLVEEIPAGRFGTPQDVAELAYCITTGHSYLTGQIITLDGGFL